jgi:hypothetical protein
VVPSGAGSGQTRIVLGPDLPPPLDTYLLGGLYPITAAIIFYGSDADSYMWQGIVDAAGEIHVLTGAVVDGVVNEVGIGNPAGFDIISNHSTNKTKLNLYPNWIDSSVAAWQPIYGSDPTDSTFKDLWNPNIQFSGGPGWSGTLKTRQLASPPFTHQVLGSLVMGGTKANGTTIATIPLASRRPVTAQDIPCSNNNVVAGGESPHLNIQPDGRVICYGFTAATVGFANGFYSTDW